MSKMIATKKSLKVWSAIAEENLSQKIGKDQCQVDEIQFQISKNRILGLSILTKNCWSGSFK